MLFDGYPEDWTVEDLYDRDEDFVAELSQALPGYEYPAISYMTIGKLRRFIHQCQMQQVKALGEQFDKAAQTGDDAAVSDVLTKLESTLTTIKDQVR